jgi:hypothetical protein
MYIQNRKLSVITKFCAFVLVFALVFSFAACKKSAKQPAPTDNNPTTEAPADGNTPVDNTAGELPNPVTPSTADEIKSTLGFEFRAPDAYESKTTYTILEGKVAQMEYMMDSGTGPILVTYRVSKSDTDNALEISGDSTSYANSEKIKVGNDQEVTIRSNADTGPALALWHNKKVVGGSVSASLAMSPVMQTDELKDAVAFFVSQESKGY